MKEKLDDILVSMMEEHKVKNIVILGHMNPDGDAAGSVMGTAHYIHVNYPEYHVIPYLSEKLDQGPKEFVSRDLVFDPFQKPIMNAEAGADNNMDINTGAGTDRNPRVTADNVTTDENYGVIVCDTATKARMIGLEFYEKAAFSIVIDHHASNEGYGDINDTRISESCAYNVFTLLDSQNLIEAAEEKHPNALDYLYLGILHDTDCFSRADAGILAAGSRILELGVSHKELEKTLHTMKLSDYEKRARMAALVRRSEDAKVAYVVIDRNRKEQMDISYEDIHPFSGILRDFSDIELGMTFYEEEPDLWRCSFRSDGTWINVNELVSPFGGGGHKGAAGLRIRTDDVEVLINEILKRVHERK